MLVGGHRYKIVVALHKITGNMTAFYIKLNWSNKGYNEVITQTQRICQIWFATKSQHFILYFYFLLCAHKYISSCQLSSYKTDYVTFNNLIVCHNNFENLWNFKPRILNLCFSIFVCIDLTNIMLYQRVIVNSYLGN